jgi:hypothetical protein
MAASSCRPFTPDEFLELGLKLRSNGIGNGGQIGAGGRKKKATQLHEFRSVYGTVPSVLSLIWSDLQTTPFEDDRIDVHIKPEHFLLVYRWLKSYESETELHTSFGMGEKTIRSHCLKITQKIALLRKIKVDPYWQDDDGLLIGHTIDGIHYRIDEPRPFSTSYSSHKFGGKAGLVYEFCVATHKQKLVWLNGPYPSGTHDKTVFRKKGLKEAIEKKQEERSTDFRVIADDGYFGADFLGTLAFRNEFDPEEIAWFKDRALSRHERFNGMTKNFKCLTKNFRHDRGWNESNQHPRHKACVEAVCVTLQYELDTGVTELFDAYPT